LKNQLIDLVHLRLGAKATLNPSATHATIDKFDEHYPSPQALPNAHSCILCLLVIEQALSKIAQKVMTHYDLHLFFY
jgi:hypothetical protein